MYLIVTETIFTFSYAVLNTFPRELPLLLRDIGNGLYDPAPYYISKVLFLVRDVEGVTLNLKFVRHFIQRFRRQDTRDTFRFLEQFSSHFPTLS